MVWWYWIFLGLALLGTELATPGGFYILFFGLSALAVGALAGFDLVTTDWLQWLLFSALAVVSLVLFRGPLLARLKTAEPTGRDVDTMVGELVIPMHDLTPGGSGQAELRGTTWNVRNAAPSALSKGQRARVERVEGLTLWIKPE
jgi:membrane protein implicated in regulation of membrane protease activity